MWNIVEVAANIEPRIVGNKIELPKGQVKIWYMNDGIVFCTNTRGENAIIFACPESPTEVSVMDISDDDKMKIRQRVNSYPAITEWFQARLWILVRNIPYEDDRYYILEALT